ncbi:unnamed protein product [Adineta steineri]|uniref:Uncharacterized protein n=3 Tax=Adineta steineri TaxID=433720 RepID=A0A815MK91_9BILA|nr:unnamed protein product [Adineta steineri]
MDIGVANSGTNNIGIFLGYGNITFTNQTTYSTGSNSTPYFLAIGDFNNDTQLDIVTANYQSDTISIFLGYGNGKFANQTSYSTGSSSSPCSVVVGYFNNDNKLDIGVVNYNNNKLGLFLGQGNGIFDNIMIFSMVYGSHPFSAVIGDFNNDGKIDFAVANDGTDNINVFLQTC